MQGEKGGKTITSRYKLPEETTNHAPGVEKRRSHGVTRRRKEKTSGPGFWPVKITSAETPGNGRTKKTRSNMRSEEPKRKPKPNYLAFNTAEKWKDLMVLTFDQRTDIGIPLCQASKNDSCQAKKPRKPYISYALRNTRGISRTSS
jgi:hypothetical protein